VVKHVSPAHRVAGPILGHVIELANLDGRHIPVVGEPGRNGPEVGPLVGRRGRDDDLV
jgi:hypothetical protein